ncbi:hypothetical protein [Komagataeibacter kakiaceti]|uniref:hypothetical protein n=1 Tax=Komagataeibacter kakiaceti TaxID=943261 RepID=UPI000A510EC2
MKRRSRARHLPRHIPLPVQSTYQRALLVSFLLGTVPAIPALAQSTTATTQATPHGRVAQPGHHPAALRSTTQETIHVQRSRATRFQNKVGTVDTMSGQELQDLHIVSPKEIAAFTPGVTAVNATSGSTPIFSIRGVGLDDYSGTNMGGSASILMACSRPIPRSITADVRCGQHQYRKGTAGV